MENYINIYAFLISLSLGLIYTYFSSPETTYIVKYPTPFNVGITTYKDSTGNCYRYTISDVDCKDNGKVLKKYKPQ